MYGSGHTPVIVVGVSGSPASACALRWAADEADREHGTLRAVRSWTTEPRAFYAHSASGPQDAARQHQLASDGLASDGAGSSGFESAPDNVTTEVIEGTAERVLVEMSAGADLLVLGSASGLAAGRSHRPGDPRLPQPGTLPGRGRGPGRPTWRRAGLPRPHDGQAPRLPRAALGRCRAKPAPERRAELEGVMRRKDVHLDAMLRHLGAAYYDSLHGRAASADVSRAVDQVAR